MQPPFDIPADLDTPVSAFLKLAPFAPHFLLESVEGGERLGRYSFIGFGDALAVVLEQGVLRMNGAASSLAPGRAPLLAALRQALARSPHPGADAPGLPFTGGLVGVVGYDLVRRFERIGPAPAARNGSPEMAFLAPRSLLVFDHVSRRIAVLHDGDEDERRSLRREVMTALAGPTPGRVRPAGHSPPSPSMSAGEFTAAVEQAQRHIRLGDVYQLVLSIRFDGRTEAHPFEIYRALRLLNPSPYLFYLELADVAVIGSSPEALVRLNGRVASLRPIAGTRPRGATGAEDRRLEQELLGDPKESAEHVMLVDLARNDLGRVAVPGTIHVDPFRAVERYSHVMHLVSGVTGALTADADAFDLFAATFPAGTVVGAPKIRAMELIDQLENAGRGLYAGTVGYFGKGGDMDHAIAIRTLWLRDGEYSFQAGAGIVAESRPDRELEEVLAKGAALEAALSLAEEGL